jgi:hypothetical protein
VAAMFVNESGRNEQSLNLVGSIYRRSSVTIAHFEQTWSPQATLVSDWLIFKILLL